MGDGGVACMSLQHHHRHHRSIMDKLPDKVILGSMIVSNNGFNGNTAGVSTGTTPTTSTAISTITTTTTAAAAADAAETSSTAAAGNTAADLMAPGPKKKKVKKVIRKVVTVRKVRKLKSEVAKEKAAKEAGNGEGNCTLEKVGVALNDEVEEGELGTLRWPTKELENGDSWVNDSLLQSDMVVKKEVIVKVDCEKDENSIGKSRRGEIKREEAKLVEKGESRSSWRETYGEAEKVESISDRWRKTENNNLRDTNFCYNTPRRSMVWRREHERSTPPTSSKFPGDDGFQRKEFGLAASQQSKNPYKWEAGQDEKARPSSKILDSDISYWDEYYNGGKNPEREYFPGNRAKRHGHDGNYELSERDRKYHVDQTDYATSTKTRRPEEGNRPVQSEHFAERSSERTSRSSSAYKSSSLEKQSFRQFEPSSSSRAVHDRHAPSPDRSPHGKARHFSHRERSPFGLERSPYSRDRSPYYNGTAHERSPRYFGTGRDRSPHYPEIGREKSLYSAARDRSPYRGASHERSPYYRGSSHQRSPYSHERSPYIRERTPYGRERSPLVRRHHRERRDRSPRIEHSPQDKSRSRDRRESGLNNAEKARTDRIKRRDNHDTSKRTKSGKVKTDSEKPSSQSKKKVDEEKSKDRDSSVKEIQSTQKECHDSSNTHSTNEPSLAEKPGISLAEKDGKAWSPSKSKEGTPCVDIAPAEELVSMEEDMDICDTPPHVPGAADSLSGKWIYLDNYGVERGPAKLADLRALVDGGLLQSDHFIKHLDSDRWMTVENAASPLVSSCFSSAVPDMVTRLVSPPEAPGNLLDDTVDSGQSGGVPAQGMAISPISEPAEDLDIDARVGALLEGLNFVPGKELEIIREALQMEFAVDQSEDWPCLEASSNDGTALILRQAFTGETINEAAEVSLRNSDVMLDDFNETRVLGTELAVGNIDSGVWLRGGQSCKGGDWKRNEESASDRSLKKKLVLNDGFPLCLMPKSGYEDPRWHEKDELYPPAQSRRLELPSWGFSCPDEKNESDDGNKTQVKPAVVRGIKGTILSVVRINACVVKDHGSFVSESRMKVRSNDRNVLRSGKLNSLSNDGQTSSVEGASSQRTDMEDMMRESGRSIATINTPKDRVCTVQDLQLQSGDWYFLDGAGREHGPVSFSEIQLLVDRGAIHMHSSVFRKLDNLWVPVTPSEETSDAFTGTHMENTSSFGSSSGTCFLLSGGNGLTSSFHDMHPQFIGFMRGKLHELVMRSYKSREFAAAINEVLDPWINVKQPKKEMDKLLYRKSDPDHNASKRPRISIEDGDYSDADEGEGETQRAEISFEDLCEGASFCEKETEPVENHKHSWGFLGGHLLARAYHFLRSDPQSLAFASSTCKHWRAAAFFYKGISRLVDFSSLGSKCTDSMLLSALNGYNNDKINAIVLRGCTNVSEDTLGEVLRAFPCLSDVDIRDCHQFGDFPDTFPSINWIQWKKSYGEAHSKMRSRKLLTEKKSAYSTTKGMLSQKDDFSNLKDYFDSVDRRDSSGQSLGRGYYKRSKLFDARKTSSIVSRDARLRRWAVMKAEKAYKRMEEFLASGLRDIMKENTFNFFVPKVAKIQDRIRHGYYSRNGIDFAKADIDRICRDAIKVKGRGDTGDMNYIISLFIQLATRMDESSKAPFQRDDGLNLRKDEPFAGLSSSSKYKRILTRVDNDRKYISKGNSSSTTGGVYDDGSYASDHEIRRRLSILNKKSIDSDSETSDDFGGSSGTSKSDSASTVSDTDSDRELLSECWPGSSGGDGSFLADEGFDDDREWGARMTKASLVPPVTRKYEVIDKYVIVADEVDVTRKMTVSLPDDYVEKLTAQKNGSEDLDMELPEVKDFKPRKQLGTEVIEQEVYGIDPFTHNLLLDSMPEELNWSLQDKHIFIEDVLLRTLNKQVRHFTGTGNTPMMYPLRPVVEEIELIAEEERDMRTRKMCLAILRAIDSRPDDKYIAYRKGLGVVCDKQGGFGEDDFVVEFLGEVYPTWKWFEKQDGIRSLQNNSKDPAPEFYNIYLERPKGDADGYDLVVVDAMHKANYASRICHSCRPNCEAKVTAVDGQYQIGIYSVRKIQIGEEITFDYNSVTESKEEYEASVCLCGSQVCRGSYLNLTGEGAFQKVLEEWHGILHRHQLMLEACEVNSVSEEDYYDLTRAGLGSCLLSGLPAWLVAYSARLVRFINLERIKLPDEILRHNLEERRKYFLDTCIEIEKSDAEVQAEGVYNQRLQNLAVTLDKVRYVMRCAYGDPKKAPPPLVRLMPDEVVSFIWKGEGSLVEELLLSMAPHMDDHMLNDLKSRIRDHDPSGSVNFYRDLKRSLLWLRDELRDLPCTYKCRHDAAADLIHVYAYTKCFFKIQGYKSVTSPPVYISPLDLGPKFSEKLGSGLHEYRKTYGENYCLGQLIFWHIQTNSEPDCTLFKASRGCLSLPEVGSFYAKLQKPSRQRIYGPRTVRFMVGRMEKQSQRTWPKDRIWMFNPSPKVFGSPMLDSVINNSPIDREMLQWLKNRPSVFQATWDR